jgi:hypothetical protein
MEFRERMRVGRFSLFHGAAMTLVVGWIGVLAFPEFLLFLPALPLMAFAPFIDGFSVKAVAAFLSILFAPSVIAFISGSWLVTLVALPLLAVALAPWPGLIARSAPVLGMAVGAMAAASKLPPRLFSTSMLEPPGYVLWPERMALAGALAGLLVGAIFGQAVARYIRD